MSEIVWQLHRDDPHPDKNTVRGVLNGRGVGGDQIVLQTVENLSRRIPAGHTYECVADYWHGGQMDTWEIIWPWDEDGDGQPDRDRLLFHPANAVRNRGGELTLLGCVAPGLGRVDDCWETFYPGSQCHALAVGLPGVASSRDAFRQFARANDGVERFSLVVTEVPAVERIAA